jgi:hypothetical protein
MKASEARISSSKANSAKSTGPRTAEGKERSRRNGLKHGMTGQGIVLPEADMAEVDIRHLALHKELAPQSIMGAILVGQLAALSVRMERGVKQEFAAVAERARHASDNFDAERVARAELLLKSIGDDIRGNLKKLRKSPEGVDVLLEAWQDLRDKLGRELRPGLGMADGVTMANLLGYKDTDAGVAWVGALTRATWADFNALMASEGGELDRDARKAWARGMLLEQIDAEIAELNEHFETLDFATIELDRAEAGARALFDPSKEASLARRYESEARRGFFKSLKEFRLVEAEAAEPAASPSVAPAIPPDDHLASSWEEPLTIPEDLDDKAMEEMRAASSVFLREFHADQAAAILRRSIGHPVPAAD